MRQTLSALLLLSLIAIAAPALTNANSDLQDNSPPQASQASSGLDLESFGLPKDSKESVDYRMNLIRTAILIAGFAVFACRFFRPLSGSEKLVRLRLILLLILAATAYASYYQFFQHSHVRGFATTDNFHYYVGSKYFDELGYFGLYECSLVALAEGGLQLPDSSRGKARDLRSMELQPYSVIKRNGVTCPERFGSARWAAFVEDVAFFAGSWPDHLQRATWRDHGFHPSPSWTLVGAALAEIAPVHDPRVELGLSRIDRGLIALAFALIAWTFGIETACLIVLIWGTGCLWRYTWVGDAFLRHLWLITAIGGVAALRRGLPLTGGAALAAAGMFRLFPGALGLGYALHAAQRSLVAGRLNASDRRFAWGAALTVGVLAGVSLLALGSSVYPDFVLKINQFSGTAVTNRVGLEVAVQSILGEVPWAATLIRLSAIAVFLGLFWGALRRTEDWEAAALGGCIVPMLVAPTNYYYSLFLVIALLATRRPRVGLILLAAATAWNVNGLVLYRTYEEFFWASVIAVAASFFVVLEVMTSKKGSIAAQENPEVSSTALRSQAPISG